MPDAVADSPARYLQLMFTQITAITAALPTLWVTGRIRKGRLWPLPAQTARLAGAGLR